MKETTMTQTPTPQTPTTQAIRPRATARPAPGQAATPTSVWRRPLVRVPIMLVGFAVVMAVANSVAAAFGNPAVALTLGPVLAVAVIALYALAVRVFERRPVNELAPTRAPGELLLGLAIGIVLAGAAMGIIALFGGFQIVGWGSVSGALTIAGTMMTVAVAEEVLFRGVIFRLVEGRFGTIIALVVSALLFGLIHLVNPGATLWGALAVAIEAGLMLGAAFVATGSLWLPIGVHLAWNTMTVAVFGTTGSGTETQNALVQSRTIGDVWLTGGSFGPEASVISIIVCSIATAGLLAVAKRRGRIVSLREAAVTYLR
jgi:membrane protease YdiL (CAAX protease family)